MAEPRTVEDVFNEIKQTYFDSPIQREVSHKRWEFVEELFEKCAADIPFHE